MLDVFLGWIDRKDPSQFRFSLSTNSIATPSNSSGCISCPFARVAAWGLEQNFFEEVSAVAEGTVKFFSENKGYGFIKQDDGGDIFFHHSDINITRFKSLAEGDRVSFDVGEGRKGPAAKNVRKL